MSFTTIGFYGSITNGSVDAKINGVLDQAINFDAASRFIVPGAWKIIAAYAMGINATGVKIDAPSLRRLALPEVYPVNATADVPTLDGPIEYGNYGPVLKPNESLSLLGSRGGADAQPMMGALWITPAVQPAAVGSAITVRATATPTIVAGSWVLAALTFDQVLPAGEFAVVGMAVVCNDCTFARLVYPGVSQLRPGVVVQDTYGDRPWTQNWRMGRMGSFGKFFNTSPPAVEFLGDTAGAESAVVYLDVVQIA